MEPTLEVTTAEEVQRKAGYQALQPPMRPPYADADLDSARRPGVPMMHSPQEWPNTRFPPEPQAGEPTSPMHGRPNKEMPPVFGTAVPLRGLSGAVRRLAYSYPDHFTRHWMLKLLGDRVEWWGLRTRRFLPLLIPLAAIGLSSRRSRRRS